MACAKLGLISYEWTIEIVAICFWVYVFFKLFVFDIDIYLVAKLDPHLMWIVDYKFFLLTGLILIGFLVFNKTNIIGFILYTVFYPLIILFWKKFRGLYIKEIVGFWPLLCSIQ